MQRAHAANTADPFPSVAAMHSQAGAPQHSQPPYFMQVGVLKSF